MPLSIYDVADRLHGKRIAIDDVVTSYSAKKESHKSSWPYLLSAQLRHVGLHADVLSKNSDISKYDVWLISLPMEFQGTFNLFGGANEETSARIKRLADFQGEIFILNQDMPDIGAFIKSRMNAACDEWKLLDPKEYTSISRSIERIDLVLRDEMFIYGDSHSVSVYVPGANISRNDGQTLHGFLKKKDSFVFPEGTKEIILYMGNIDVRHHIFRQEDPMGSLRSLVKRYVEFARELKETHGMDYVGLVSLLPIEHEERRIPKTGWYKGSPFFGTMQQRSEAVTEFNRMLDDLSAEYGYDVISWPSEWYSMDPKQYADQCMEKPGSVHLSRSSYQYDFETGQKMRKMKTTVLFLDVTDAP
jgi:hypothetical protein